MLLEFMDLAYQKSNVRLDRLLNHLLMICNSSVL